MTEPTYEPAPPAGSPSRSNGPAIAALITGIIGLLLSWIPGINLLAFVLAIAAVITGVIGLKNANEPGTGGKGMAITGLVTGALAIVIGVLIYIGLASVINNNPDLQEQIEDLQEEQNG